MGRQLSSRRVAFLTRFERQLLVRLNAEIFTICVPVAVPIPISFYLITLYRSPPPTPQEGGLVILHGSATSSPATPQSIGSSITNTMGVLAVTFSLAGDWERVIPHSRRRKPATSVLHDTLEPYTPAKLRRYHSQIIWREGCGG